VKAVWAPGLRATALWAMALRATALWAMALWAVILAAGCAGTGRSDGVRLLEHGRYAAAVEALRAEAASRPDDPLIQRNLGVALLESGRAADAADIFRKVRIARPREAGTAFQLGRACEGSGDFDGALAAYRDYLALGGRGKDEVAARLQAVTRRRIEAEMRAVLAHEDSLATVEVPDNAVAVPDFANPARSDSLAPLARGLAAMLISDLERVGSLRVLERARIRVLLDELAMAAPAASDSLASAPLPPIASPEGLRARLETLVRPSTGQPYLAKAELSAVNRPVGIRDSALPEAIRAFQSDHGLWVDGIAGRVTSTALESAWQSGPGKQAAGRAAPMPRVVASGTAPRLGRLLGARRFIQGSFLPLPAEQLQLDANVVEASTGISLPAGAPVSGALRDVLRLQKELLHRILQALGIELTPGERGRLDELPTRDFLAFLAYSRGLELEDQGRGTEAESAYREATRRDPSFGAAATRMRISAVTPSAQQQLDSRELSRLERPEALPADKVLRTGTWTGLGPGPDMDRTDDLDPGRTDAQTASPADARIIVEGDVPGGIR
jgi:tetratricopeptide (TPR) repeat protein